MEIEKDYIKRLLVILESHIELIEGLMSSYDDKDVKAAYKLALDEICCAISFIVSEGKDVFGYEAYLKLKSKVVK